MGTVDATEGYYQMDQSSKSRNPIRAGAAYVKNVQLPGSTMTLRGEVMVVADSTFAGLQSFGDAAIVFAASNVTFINTTFVTSNNSAGAAIYSLPALAIYNGFDVCPLSICLCGIGAILVVQ